MKKNLMYIIIGITILLFVGCKGDDQETDFIPLIPSDGSVEDEVIPENPDEEDQVSEEVDDSEDSEDSDEVADVEETTTMYVKLVSYGAILNVRSTPTTDADNVVGFLVHTEAIEVMNIENGWASFMHKGDLCYISQDYLVDSVPPYISPPTPQS